MEPPCLSVVIACLDSEDVLGVQLEALARQHCPLPWEVVVSDNGSRDGSVALAESYADRLRLRVVDAGGVRGAGPARNAGVAAAQGEWIAFCDADDEVGDGWVAGMCEALARHPFVAGRLDSERLNSARTRRSRPVDQDTGLQWSSEVGLPHAGAGNLGIHRSAFRQVGGFDPAVRYLQDTDLCWRVQRAGYPLVFVPELVVHVRLRSTLRDMYRQGRNYGASQAALERRYVSATRPGPDGVGPDGVEPAGGADGAATGGADGAAAGGAGAHRGSAWRAVRGAVRLTARLVTSRASVGQHAWQLGWHIGHRAG